MRAELRAERAYFRLNWSDLRSRRGDIGSVRAHLRPGRTDGGN